MDGPGGLGGLEGLGGQDGQGGHDGLEGRNDQGVQDGQGGQGGRTGETPECRDSRDASCAPPTVQRGVEAGEGGTFTGSVPALVAGGVLMAAACAGALYRLFGRRTGAEG
ncbi:hypothetical protein [Streptomyces sp. NPDC006739]|uniref:hypothetical protein n=1 Tax=Streptomyces sp. NPDC006739 TaxID=3364763 RepID=UPI003684F32F